MGSRGYVGFSVRSLVWRGDRCIVTIIKLRGRCGKSEVYEYYWSIGRVIKYDWRLGLLGKIFVGRKGGFFI